MSNDDGLNFDPHDFRVLLARGTKKAVACYTSEWKGNDFFHIRNVFKDDGGNWRPTREGVTVLAREKDLLIAALKGTR